MPIHWLDFVFMCGFIAFLYMRAYSEAAFWHILVTLAGFVEWISYGLFRIPFIYCPGCAGPLRKGDHHQRACWDREWDPLARRMIRDFKPWHVDFTMRFVKQVRDRQHFIDELLGVGGKESRGKWWNRK